MQKPILLNEVSELPIEFLPKNSGKPNVFYKNNVEVENLCSSEILDDARRAAEAHRRARYKIQNLIKPGISLTEIVETVENATRTMLKGEMNDGIGFPTGVSLNDCAAHYTTNPGDKEIYLKESDVLKIDFGSHVNGRIMDSAFTITFDPKFENLLKASKEGTNVGLKSVGVDVRVCDVGAAIEEVIKSYEVEIDGKTYPIVPVENLNGHSINQFKIHGGVSVPIVKNSDTTRLTENTFYAIETFASTGNGYVNNGPNCSHYMLDPAVRTPINSENNKKVFRTILKNFGTLPFCPRYVDSFIKLNNGSLANVRSLSLLGIIEPYPPLHDIKNSYVSQFEHTLYLTENGKEILTKGDDY